MFVHSNCTDSIDSMIPEKVTWVEFPARISAVNRNILPINDLNFHF